MPPKVVSIFRDSHQKKLTFTLLRAPTSQVHHQGAGSNKHAADYGLDGKGLVEENEG